MEARYKVHMGDDLLVVDAARVSFAKESWYINGEYIPKKGSKHYQEWVRYRDWALETGALWDDKLGHRILSVEDFGLLRFLAEHGHWTPFAHPQITLVMKAPVPIRTQCFKHKQGFVENEESRRYISSRPELYIPDHFRAKPDNAKQGSAGKHPSNKLIKAQYEGMAQLCIDKYESWIKAGVCPEQARFILPQGVYVNWYWTGSLAAYARFYAQRSDSHAQAEVAELAAEVGDNIKQLYPLSWYALTGKGEAPWNN